MKNISHTEQATRSSNGCCTDAGLRQWSAEARTPSFRHCTRGEEREHREKESEAEKTVRRQREDGLVSACCTPLSVSSPFVLLFLRCPHGTVLLVMVGLDHMAVGMDVDVAVRVESQKYAPISNGSARSAVLETGGVVRIADTVRVSRTSMRIPPRPRHRRKLLSWRGRQLIWTTRSQYWLAREFWRKKLQRKLSGPKKTAKHIEAKHNWINRESKRLESESAKLAEWQEGLRVRKETLRGTCKEIKILREDLLREGESIDKNKSHFMSLENTEEIRILEQQELAFWRESASKRHETVQRRKSPAGCWKLRDSTEKWKQRRENSKRRSRKNQGKMPEWETTPWMVWMVLCRREGANADIASNIRVATACGRERIRVCRVL